MGQWALGPMGPWAHGPVEVIYQKRLKKLLRAWANAQIFVYGSISDDLNHWRLQGWRKSVHYGVFQ